MQIASMSTFRQKMTTFMNRFTPSDKTGLRAASNTFTWKPMSWRCMILYGAHSLQRQKTTCSWQLTSTTESRSPVWNPGSDYTSRWYPIFKSCSAYGIAFGTHLGMSEASTTAANCSYNSSWHLWALSSSQMTFKEAISSKLSLWILLRRKSELD